MYIFKDRILPLEKISENDKQNALNNLNRIIQCRLALSEFPTQLKNFDISNFFISYYIFCIELFHKFFLENGYVIFTVKNEFEIKLTLINDNFRNPWRLLHLKFLVKDSQDPSFYIFY